MYFSQFESYEQARTNLKSFRVEALCDNGVKITSSDIPASYLEIVTDDIDMCEQARVAFQIWDYHTGTLTTIPYHSLAALRIIMVA